MNTSDCQPGCAGRDRHGDSEAASVDSEIMIKLLVPVRMPLTRTARSVKVQVHGHFIIRANTVTSAGRAAKLESGHLGWESRPLPGIHCKSRTARRPGRGASESAVILTAGSRLRWPGPRPGGPRPAGAGRQINSRHWQAQAGGTWLGGRRLPGGAARREARAAGFNLSFRGCDGMKSV